MPPVRSEPFLTPERRLKLLEQIRARHETRIAVGLAPNAVDPEEEVGGCGGRWQRGSAGGVAGHPRFPPLRVDCGGQTPSLAGDGGRGGDGDTHLHG